MAKRKEATEFIIKYIGKLLPKSGNVEIYEKFLGGMSDEQFSDYMKLLESGEEILFLISPNFNKNKISLENNLKIAKELNYSFFQKLILTDPHTGIVYKTPIPYMVIDIPLKRMCQTLNKKISIPKDNAKVDVLTGQYVGKPTGATLSFPELQTLHSQSLDRTIEELITFRGGNEEAFRDMNKSILDSGRVRMDSLPKRGKVKSTQTLSTYLKAIHLQNNL